ncbi:MAG: GAF domain-containing protein [Fimbriimonadales bacterium]
MIDRAEGERIVRVLSESRERGGQLRAQAMRLLSELPDYRWVGVYRLEGDTLVLAEYVGAPTEHDRIPVGRGVCGTAVAENRNVVVQDVRELDNYLACSLETRSEIVVLIRDAEGRILGQIDVDGHRVGAFDSTDEALLEQVAAILAARWEG